MTESRSAGCTVTLDELLAFSLGELPEERAESLEGHLFECSRCSERVESVDGLRTGIREAVLAGAVGASLDRSFLDHAAADGLVLRDYRIREGGSVACTSSADDDLVIVRLAAEFGDAKALELAVDFENLESGEHAALAPREVLVNRPNGEVVLVFPGETVRGYPRSRWTLWMRDREDEGRPTIGPFVMDHTPGDG